MRKQQIVQYSLINNERLRKFTVLAISELYAWTIENKVVTILEAFRLDQNSANSLPDEKVDLRLRVFTLNSYNMINLKMSTKPIQLAMTLPKH
jgi:hypothetical protein